MESNKVGRKKTCPNSLVIAQPTIPPGSLLPKAVDEFPS